MKQIPNLVWLVIIGMFAAMIYLWAQTAQQPLETVVAFNEFKRMVAANAVKSLSKRDKFAGSAMKSP